jgi:hypothetical protein
MAKPKVHSAKIGTIPALIILRRAYKLKVGLMVEFRDWKKPHTWRRGKIDQINPDGHLFISLF